MHKQCCKKFLANILATNLSVLYNYLAIPTKLYPNF